MSVKRLLSNESTPLENVAKARKTAHAKSRLGLPVSLKTILIPLIIHRQPQALTRLAQNSIFDRNIISIITDFMVGFLRSRSSLIVITIGWYGTQFDYDKT